MPIISQEFPTLKYRSGKGRRLTSADDEHLYMVADRRLRYVQRSMGHAVLCSLVFSSFLSSIHGDDIRTATKEGKISKVEL